MPLKYDRLAAILITAMITITLDETVSNAENTALTQKIECRTEYQLNTNIVDRNNIGLKYVSHEPSNKQLNTSIEQLLKKPYQFKF